MKKKKEEETKKKSREKATTKRKKKSNNEEDLSVQYKRGLDLDLFGNANTAGVPPGAATTQNVVASPVHVARATLSPTVPLGAASTPNRQVFLGAASTQSRQVFLGDAPSPVEHQEAKPTISGVKNAQKSRGRRGLDLDLFGDANTAGVPPGAATTQNMVVSPVPATAFSPTVPLGDASTHSPQVFPESS